MEKISVKKAGASFVSGLDWFKSSMIGVKIIVILLIGYTVYRAWFMEKNKQNTQIVVQKGGKLNLKQIQGSNKRFQTFGELYGFCETDGRYGLGVRAGIKF